ncbi:MAG: peptidylprolyl isomerase [Roseovarius sp.]
MRIALSKAAAAVLTCLLLQLMAAAVPPAAAQGLFEPVIKVNDQAITRFEIEQRARMLALFRTPGDPVAMARAQLIEDRLKMDAARNLGIKVSDAAIDAAAEEFAARGNMSAEEMIKALKAAGVEETSFRDFVRAGVTWREVVRARFAGSVSVSNEDVERAKQALAGGSGVRVLLSEIVLPVPPGRREEVMRLAEELSRIKSTTEFAEAARRYSAAPSADRGGRLEWTAISDLPEPLRPIVLALSPGEVSDPLPTEQAIILLQLRDIAETEAPPPQYSAIEYAMYFIAGGRSDKALAQAAQIAARVDTCDDLYGVAKGQPPEVLVRESKAPGEIPPDIARELERLDPGEVSTNLTRNNGQTLVFLMLCGRTPKLANEGVTAEDLSNFVRNQRLDSLAKGYLEQLRAEARIVELK